MLLLRTYFIFFSSVEYSDDNISVTPISRISDGIDGNHPEPFQMGMGENDANDVNKSDHEDGKDVT